MLGRSDIKRELTADATIIQEWRRRWWVKADVTLNVEDT